MTDPGRHAVGGRGGWRWIVAGALVVAGLSAAGLMSLVVIVARRIVTPVGRPPETTAIRSIDLDRGVVALSRSAETIVPGRYGLWTGGGSAHLKLGDVLAESSSTVTRRILATDFGDASDARRGRISGVFHLRPEEAGFYWDEVVVQVDGGAAPAWLIPAESESGWWVIFVHGWGANRSEGLRAVPVFHRAGFTCLLPSWRNDGDAPASADGRYGLGGTEWSDVDAAVGYAVDHGATDIVLMGWSMGGAIALQTMVGSRYLDRIRGVALDSPVVDWVPTLHFHAGRVKLPMLARRAVVALLGDTRSTRLTGQRSPIDFHSLDFVSRANDLTVPVLLMHSIDDGFVPPIASIALATARPEVVTFHRWKLARHARLWNLDSVKYEAQISAWLSAQRFGPSRRSSGHRDTTRRRRAPG